ncbi:hypothetical protein V8J88_03455 [Massilia sp. W12]|uniref:hypothetical protein n=1 Tax=Massilia sp. W12 TaxID=3126507 RepID=UPI0030CDBAB2
MPIQVQTATLQPGATKSFNFSDTITQRMVGISAYSLSYGSSTDHHVETVSVSLVVNQSGNTLQVTAHATMVDANGHNLSASSSSITVVAVAWVGLDDPGLKLANANGIGNGGTSSPIVLSNTNPSILQAALSGFYLSYGSTDHHMETSAAAVGTSLNGNEASITGVVYMYDENGHNASQATVDGGMFANTDPSLGAYVLATDSLQNKSETLTFPAAVNNVYPLLSSFKVQFQSNHDHHVKTMGASLTVSHQAGSNTATVTGAAVLKDNSGNSQDNNVSNVTGFVIGF